MPFVKVPGVEREIWVDLHEPERPETPWFTIAGELVQLTPEQFAAEMASPNSDWKFPGAHETAFLSSREDAEAFKAEARSFEPLLRAARAKVGGVGGAGRPVSTVFSAAEDIAVLATYFMRCGLKRQAAIYKAADFWTNGIRWRKEPSKRLIDAALARIRRGGVSNLSLVVDQVRKKYSLPELPVITTAKGKPAGRIK